MRALVLILFLAAPLVSAERNSADSRAVNSEQKVPLRIVVLGAVESPGEHSIESASLAAFMSSGRIKLWQFVEEVKVERREASQTFLFRRKLKELSPKSDFTLREGDRLLFTQPPI